MADVFISYSKRRSEPAKALAEQLNAKGIEVWWDTSLKSGQAFDDVIRKELEAADAAIVIWTPELATSQYVKMEAGIAFGWDKLITVRTADLSAEDIPQPFGRLHADIVTDVERVMIALGEKGVLPKGSKRKRLSKGEVLAALGQVDSVSSWSSRRFLEEMPEGQFSRRFQPVDHGQSSNTKLWRHQFRHALYRWQVSNELHIRLIGACRR